MKNKLLITAVIIFSMAFNLLAQNLTPAEKLAKASIQRANSLHCSDRVKYLLDAAIAEQNMLKINAINDILAQIRVAIIGIDNRFEAMERFLDDGDIPNMNKQYCILMIYIIRVGTLRDQAEQCVGDLGVIGTVGDLIVVVDEDIGGMGGDPPEEEFEFNRGSVETIITFRNIDGDEIRLIVTTTGDGNMR